MGMGDSPMHVDLVSRESLREEFPELMEEIEAYLDKTDTYECWEVQEIEDLDTKDSERFFEVVDKLQKEFYELTGATLNLGYHNQELNGDRYDSVDGWFFHVTGVRELNEAGKQVDEEFELLQNRGYVVFG